jgi:hypothetical protein
MLLSFERPTPPLEADAERTALGGSGARRGTHPRRYLENYTAVEVVFSNDGES